MYKFFIGCDMSKDFFDVSYTKSGQAIYLGQFPNSVKGFKKFISQLKLKTKIKKASWLICFENTGIYSKQFLTWLFSQSIPCLEENPIQIKRSLGLKRGKSDKVDSINICRYAFEKRDSIKTSKPLSCLIISIKNQLSRRSLLIKHRQALSVSVSEQKIILEPKVWKELNKQNQKLVLEYSKQIKEIEKNILGLINSNKAIKKNYKLITSIIGIGPIISAALIVATNNFEKFSDARKLACFIGIAPFSNSSGKFKGRNRVSNLANKKIKALLSNAVISARLHDNQIKMYYERKLKEGKENGVIYNAIKNKLIHRVFAVIKRKTPYVAMMNYA